MKLNKAKLTQNTRNLMDCDLNDLLYDEIQW